MAIDDFSKICAIRDKLVEEHNLNYKPHVHADSVIGWAYANFLDYNYKENLDLPKSVIKKIEKILSRKVQLNIR